MGGLIILNSALVSMLLWGRFSTRPSISAASPMFVTLWMGVIGFLDDYLKMRQKRRGEKNRGLVERYKLVGQVTAGLALGWYLWQHPAVAESVRARRRRCRSSSTTSSRSPRRLLVYVLFTTFILTGTSNAVNITDGLDGLAAGLSAIAFGTFAIFSYIIGRVDYSRYLNCSTCRTPAS